MTDEDFKNLCAKHGLLPEEARLSLRHHHKLVERAKLIVDMRERLLMSYDDIAQALIYSNRSGARHAYYHALELSGIVKP